jgi:hypothetical protein
MYNRKFGLVSALVLAFFVTVLGHVKADNAASSFSPDINPNADVASQGGPSNVVNIRIEESRFFEKLEERDFAEETLEVDGDIDEEDFFAFLRKTPDNSKQQQRRKTQQQTSTRVNIFQKLGESLGTSIVGCLLIALMPCLIWKNEGRHVDQLSRIEFCKNNAVAVDWYVSKGSSY